MSFKLGDGGEALRPFQEWLNRKFSSYSNIKVDLAYGLDEARVVAEAMRRYGMPPTFMTVKLSGVDTRIEGAVATDDFLRHAGYFPPEPQCVVFSINGAGSTWNMGYPFDIGETLDKSKCWHQPIGYNTNPVPMATGVKDGQGEFIRQLDMPRGSRGLNCTVLPWGGIFYSMGALVGMGVLDRVLHGDLGRFKATFIGASTFGNPRRQNGHTFPGCSWSSGEGIATPTDHDLPDSVWEMAADKHMPGSDGDDLYTKMADDENATTSTDMRAVWDIINKGNPLSLGEAVLMLLAKPSFTGGYSAAIAAFKALDFFVAKQTGPHVRYQFTLPIENDPRDCWELARAHMADLVARLPVGARG